MNMKIIDLQVSWQKEFLFKINPITLKVRYLWISDLEKLQRTINGIKMNGLKFNLH